MYPSTGELWLELTPACVTPEVAAPMSELRRTENRCHGPRQESVSGVAKSYFFNSNADPLIPQAVGDVTADCRRDHRHHDEVEPCPDLEAGG
jgi:hypothetical protein